MRCDVYRSRQQTLILLVVVLAFGTLLFSIRQRLPVIAQAGLGLVICLSVVGQIHGLLSNKPAFSVDESGIHYNPKWFPAIDWRDVVSAERLPAVEVLSEGETLRRDDSTRPIRLTVRNRDHYLVRVPKLLHSQMFLGAAPDCLHISIDFTGLNGESEKVYDCIQHYLHSPRAKS
jgi:hypothetical protein